MTHSNGLIDAQLERGFVASLIRDPSLIESAELAAADLEDFQARAAMAALINVWARGVEPTPEAIRAQLQIDHDLRGPHRSGEQSRDLRWFESLLADGSNVQIPVCGWTQAILELKTARETAVLEADELAAQESKRRVPPRGPRAHNAEPCRLAEAFRRYLYEQDGDATLVRWAHAWWRYDGTRYVEHDDEFLDRDLIRFLDVVVAPQQTTDKKTGAQRVELRRVTSRNKTVSELRKSSFLAFPMVHGGAPQWTSPIDSDASAIRVVPCANGILDLRDRTLLPKTPRLFSTTAIATGWDPAAEAPRWLAFLRSLWGDDTDSIQALQQMFGYFLTPDTSQQKIFSLVGLIRSGKGTIARILRALLGEDAVVNPTLDGLEGSFGLEPIIGKTLAIIGDARLGGAQEQPRIVERLLSISGEDALLVNRKNAGQVNVRFRTRVLLLSNELPRLHDTSGAMASRFIILRLTKSFLGCEDTTLESKLLTELPGIFRWAVDGYENLLEQGRFTTPATSIESQHQMRAVGSPVLVFLDECCEVGSEHEISMDDLYARYQEWSKANGHDRPRPKQWFGRDLNTVMPELTRVQRTVGVRVGQWHYKGIRLKHY